MRMLLVPSARPMKPNKSSLSLAAAQGKFDVESMKTALCAARLGINFHQRR